MQTTTVSTICAVINARRGKLAIARFRAQGEGNYLALRDADRRLSRALDYRIAQLRKQGA